MRRDFNDLSLVISVRIDSGERLENVREIVRFIKAYTSAHIYVIEADAERKIPELGVEKQLFFTDNDPVFHRTRYTNIALRQTFTPFVGIWDADMLVDPVQLEIAMEWLRLGEKTMVLPFDARCYDVPAELKKMYLEKKDITYLHTQQDQMPFKFGRYALGGIFLIRREDYEKAGWENEHFYGWGHEDVERVKRAEILGAKTGFVKGPVYHLYHPRLINSKPATRDQDSKNRNELLKVCRMNPVALREYIAMWQESNFRV